MHFKNKKHGNAFEEIFGALDRKNHALLAAVYLLTADEDLWNRAGRAVGKCDIDFRNIGLANGLQIDGAVDKVMSPYPIDEKLKAFGFHVAVIDGHDFNAIEAAMEEAKTVKGQPSAIIMKTTKGKGVSYMEGQAGWHGKAPNDAEYEIAMGELKAALAEVEGN